MKKNLTFFVVVIPLVVLVFTAFNRRALDPHEQSWAVKEKNWRQGGFVPADDPKRLESAVAKWRIEASTPLSSEQEALLRKAVCSWVETYQNGSYEAIASFRAYRPEALDVAPLEKVLKNYAKVYKVGFSADPEQAVREFHKLRNTMKIQAVSEVAPRIVVSARKSAREDLNSHAFAFFGRSTIPLHTKSPFRQSDTPEGALVTDGQLLCAYVSIVCQVNHPKELWPIHMSFYWSSKLGRWMSWEFITDSMANLDTLSRSFFF